ncbi:MULTISPECIES: hypothetical protein [Agrobacterium tumefaciens complex]|uniref:hypothetical protein n=1 Tax=Agrobacterium tumefaciens complex TaxID=1183400 RepID=UPI0009CC14A2|nr:MULTISPECIES: hypothetical protein [Agrobacterium tumefaciens complex]MBP2532624.1 hypothetical protein [Agrobacterium tumefaciens]CUX26673.1 exported hypothetical protein [Agrobacterium fabrum str. J-07]
MTKIGLLLLFGLAAVSLIGAGILFIDRNATYRAVIKTERQNNAAGDRADSARHRFDDCAGGVWDFGAGRCIRPAPGGRD